jgi:lipopolysaccharide/colanic/teichoic acid biosynthesis glycosyltransferase
MKILYVDQYFTNREGITGARGYEFARRLVAQGHRVTLLACASRYSILGAEGQRGLVRRVTIDGIDVISIRTPYAQQMSVVDRLRSFFSFMVWAALVGAWAGRCDVIFASSTPLTVGAPALFISRLRGIPYVFEVRDLWPRAPIELGYLPNPWAQRLARFAERLFYRGAAKIVALSPGMADGVVAAGEPRGKVVVIPNACDSDLFAAADPAGVRAGLGVPGDATLIIHAGALGVSNDGDWLLDWAAQWRALGRTDLWLLLLGEGGERPRLERRARAEGLDRVLFAGPVTRRETANWIAAADAGVVSFADKPVLGTNSPNKFFDYLAAGRPALVNTAGWTAELLAETGAGLALPRDTSEAARLTAELADDPARRRAMGERARALAVRFDRDKLAAELTGVLTEAAACETCGVERAAKRLTDIVGACLTLALFAPFLAALAAAVALDSPGGVFYRSPRVGRNGRPFGMWKFRTMTAGADRQGDGLNVGADDARITRVGRFLRDWSLDELPQVFNILAGDMSVVGPRPALAEHAALYTDAQKARLRVRPGLTGWAQINGRNQLTWDQKLAYDADYATSWSLWGDVKIVCKTVAVVLRREGLYEPDAGKADPFNKFDDGDRGTPDAK